MPSVIGTAANLGDVTKADELLHGRETVAFSDAGLAPINGSSANGGSCGV